MEMQGITYPSKSNISSLQLGGKKETDHCKGVATLNPLMLVGIHSAGIIKLNILYVRVPFLSFTP